MKTITNDTSMSFIQKLNQRIEAYMNSPKSYIGDIMLYSKTIFFLVSYVVLYWLIVFGDYTILQRYGWTILLGVVQVCIVINIAHDGVHYAYRGPSFFNRLAALSMNFVGGNAYVFRTVHATAHKSKDVLIQGGNLEQQALVMNLKGGNENPILFFLKKFIVPAMYLFYSFYLIFVRDIVLMYSKELSGGLKVEHPWYEYIVLWVFKILYIVAFLIVPYVLLDVTVLELVIAFLTIYLVISILMIIVLLMPEGVDEVPIRQEGESEENFVARIILAGHTDYAPRNLILNFLLGGTNVNIGHKLYPKIAHTHHPAISRIIKKTCQEYNLKYDEGSVLNALTLHMKFVGGLGKDDKRDEVPNIVEGPVAESDSML